MVGIDNKVYVIGGYGGPSNSNCLSSVERYDPHTNKWEEVASMQTGRRSLAAISTDRHIFAIGGYNGKTHISSIERYDYQLNQWETFGQLTSTKCVITAVLSPDKQSILIMGGFNGTQLETVERLDCLTGEVTKETEVM